MKVTIQTFSVTNGILVKIVNDASQGNTISFIAPNNKIAHTLVSDYLDQAIETEHNEEQNEK